MLKKTASGNNTSSSPDTSPSPTSPLSPDVPDTPHSVPDFSSARISNRTVPQISKEEKVPSYVNLARCVNGYTSLTSYTSPARREYSPARRDFSPIGRTIDPSQSSTITNMTSPQNRTIQLNECLNSTKTSSSDHHSYEQQHQYLKLSMLDSKQNENFSSGNYSLNMSNNSSNKNSRLSRTLKSNFELRQPTKSYQLTSADDTKLLNDSTNRFKNRNNHCENDSLLNRRSSSTSRTLEINNYNKKLNLSLNNSNTNAHTDNDDDSICSDIKRRVKLLEKASCNSLKYNINKSNNNIVNNLTTNNRIEQNNRIINNNDREIITIDNIDTSSNSCNGSPIPVMKLLNPEFRAMLGKTTKTSPNKFNNLTSSPKTICDKNNFNKNHVGETDDDNNGFVTNKVNLKTILNNNSTNNTNVVGTNYNRQGTIGTPLSTVTPTKKIAFVNNKVLNVNKNVNNFKQSYNDDGGKRISDGETKKIEKINNKVCGGILERETSDNTTRVSMKLPLSPSRNDNSRNIMNENIRNSLTNGSDNGSEEVDKVVNNVEIKFIDCTIEQSYFDNSDRLNESDTNNKLDKLNQIVKEKRDDIKENIENQLNGNFSHDDNNDDISDISNDLVKQLDTITNTNKNDKSVVVNENMIDIKNKNCDSIEQQIMGTDGHESVVNSRQSIDSLEKEMSINLSTLEDDLSQSNLIENIVEKDASKRTDDSIQIIEQNESVLILEERKKSNELFKDNDDSIQIIEQNESVLILEERKKSNERFKDNNDSIQIIKQNESVDIIETNKLNKHIDKTNESFNDSIQIIEHNKSMLYGKVNNDDSVQITEPSICDNDSSLQIVDNVKLIETMNDDGFTIQRNNDDEINTIPSLNNDFKNNHKFICDNFIRNEKEFNVLSCQNEDSSQIINPEEDLIILKENVQGKSKKSEEEEFLDENKIDRNEIPNETGRNLRYNEVNGTDVDLKIDDEANSDGVIEKNKRICLDNTSINDNLKDGDVPLSDGNSSKYLNDIIDKNEQYVIRDGEYYKQILNKEREVLFELLNTYEIIINSRNNVQEDDANKIRRDIEEKNQYSKKDNAQVNEIHRSNNNAQNMNSCTIGEHSQDGSSGLHEDEHYESENKSNDNNEAQLINIDQCDNAQIVNNELIDDQFNESLKETGTTIEHRDKSIEQIEDYHTISNELEGLIFLTLGQCKLLLNKKFPFFEKSCQKSIDQFKARNNLDGITTSADELPILNEDLSGLWDAICIQIVDVKNKFDKLNEIRKNNWKTVDDEKDSNADNGQNEDTQIDVNKKRKSLNAVGKQKMINNPLKRNVKSTSQLNSKKKDVVTNASLERKKFLQEKRKLLMAEKQKKNDEEQEKEENLVQFL